MAIIYKLQIHQIDVKTTILNGKLNEEIYMGQAKVFVTFGHKKDICKLVKSLYDLK